MALLIPQNQNQVTPGWFDGAIRRNEREDGKDVVDKQIGTQWETYPSHRTRRVSNYYYWHNRLLILEEEFNNVSTWSLKSWWYDGRKGRVWVSFWIEICGFTLAMLALVLAVASTFVAALQAVEANRYAQEANTLASLANEYASNANTSDAANTGDPTTTFTTILLAGTTNFISTNVNQINNHGRALSECTPVVGARELVAAVTSEPLPSSS